MQRKTKRAISILTVMILAMTMIISQGSFVFAESVTIENTVSTNGLLTANVSGGTGEYIYKWYKSDNGRNNSWTEVTREKITGDEYNISEDGRSLNVALDDGARKYYKVEIYNENNVLVAQKESGQIAYYDALQNGSFEIPSYNGMTNYISNDDYRTEGIWQTTGVGTGEDDKGKDIEIVNPSSNASNSNGYNCASAAQGVQFAELNCEAVGALYQDVLTAPGQTLNWKLSHRARGVPNHGQGSKDSINKNAKDTMYLLIMNTNDVSSETTQAQLNSIVETFNITNSPGTNAKTGPFVSSQYPGAQLWKITSDNKAWYEYSGSYTVPDANSDGTGQYLTRFFFVSAETFYDNWDNANKDLKNTVGNLIDDVSFTSNLPGPVSGKGQLLIEKKFEGLTEDQINSLKDSLAFTYKEGNTSQTVQLNEFKQGKFKNTYQYSIDVDLGKNDRPKNYTVTESEVNVEGFELETKQDGNAVDVNKTYKVEKNKTTTASFVNTYTPKVRQLEVKKIVTGNLGDTGKDFTFNMKLKKGDAAYKDSITYTVKEDAKTATLNCNENGIYTFTLKHNESKTFTLPYGITYEISEVNADGYNITVEDKDSTTTQDDTVGNGTLNGEKGSIDTVIFTNNKTVAVDTGVDEDMMPMLMLFMAVATIIACGGIYKVMRRKRKFD